MLKLAMFEPINFLVNGKLLELFVSEEEKMQLSNDEYLAKFISDRIDAGIIPGECLGNTAGVTVQVLSDSPSENQSSEVRQGSHASSTNMNLLSSPSPNPNEELAITTDENSSDKAHWTDQSTKLLISLLKTHGLKKLSRKKLYKLVSEEMEKKGLKFSPSNIANKFYSLERSYKRKKDNDGATGRGALTLKYENELEDLLGARPSISPEYTEGVAGPPSPEHASSLCNSPTKRKRTPEYSPRKKKRGGKHTLLADIKNLIKENHEKKMAMLEKHNKVVEEIMKKRNDLLEKQVELLSKLVPRNSTQ